MRLDQEALRQVEARAHTHNFPGLVCFERSAGALNVPRPRDPDTRR
jgi:hypothetical protein